NQMGVVFRPDPRRAARNKNRTGWQRPLVMRSMMRSTYDAKPPPGSLADFVTDIRPAYSPALASPELTALPAPAHRAPGIRNSSEPGRNSWNDRATPLFREGSASPKMIRTGRLNSFNLGIFCVRERTMGNKSSFRRKKAGRALGVASNC